MPKKKNEINLEGLSSRERKALRRPPDEKTKEGLGVREEGLEVESLEVEGLEVEGIEQGEATIAPKRKLGKRQILIIVLLSLLTLGIILTAIIWPVSTIDDRYYARFPSPVVVFDLSNGDRLEILVFEEEVPHASTNFLYLARIGFFTNTIIFDTTNDFVRFGQYEDSSLQAFRPRNERFTNRVRDISLPSTAGTDVVFAHRDIESVFDYRLERDTTARANHFNTNNYARNRGFVSQLHMLSGTDFQIAGRSGASLIQQRIAGTGTQTRNMAGHVFGQLTDSSLLALDRIIDQEGEFARNPNTGHPFWQPPSTTITITRTRVFNIDFWGKWRQFNFDEFFRNPYGYFPHNATVGNLTPVPRRMHFNGSPNNRNVGIRRDMD